MNKGLERRIEAATRALPVGGYYADEDIAASKRSEALRILNAAFPELFTDPPQAWIAPMEPTREMIDRGGDTLSDCVDSGWDSSPDGESYASYESIIPGSQTTIWNAMRDAHLTTGAALMHGETDE